ncbi:MAG: mannose-1-phosphate guanylyltransferase [Bacteroidales bacterium]|nr:mannose-1-phosphate guanylyltransferase [Bacteroidales bacterium]HNW72141.1 mannose-1-phosphate guanylyltransferase [Bacteroidales bacterium]HPS49182.1 mannose-1-phosphate guanylyltransferase [Bacteroidales bacterium]
MAKSKHNFCVIMAGGIGARFWPMSRTSHPKQFIDILGTGETLIQQTYKRFSRICPKENIYIVTNELYKKLVQTQLPELTSNQILLEPARRNTAPCVAYANHCILSRDPEARIVVAPSDHIILKEEIFLKNIETALEAAAENDWLLTLGIRPSRPDTGYGYIQYVDGHEEVYPKEPHLRKVKTFTEKPNLELAITFLKCGDFLWNSGIFIWSLKSIMKAFETFLPEVNNLFKMGVGKFGTRDEKKFIGETYTICKSISLDYGVMEKADNVYVLAADFGWSDLGTWGSLYENRPKDAQGNTVIGKNVMLYDTSHCIVNMPRDKVVVLQGLTDYIVVESEEVLLVCRKTDEQNIRQYVNDVMLEKGEKYV